jgi:hypothetical protein
MKKVTDGQSNCRLHFGQASFGSFEKYRNFVLKIFVQANMKKLLKLGKNSVFVSKINMRKMT